MSTSQDDFQSFSDSRRYELVSEIAAGGMGTVYRGLQHGTQGFKKTVALKMILPKFSRQEEFARLFIGEAKLVADLVHENIVQVYHLGDLQDQYYIAMEYVEGINLQDFMIRHRTQEIEIDPDLAAFIISRLCRGLEYAHNKRGRDGQPLNIVHRDISPRNVLINYEGVVKLTDFGIAKARRLMEQREGKVLMGKYAYMSPEQANLRETDRRSDLFSLGIVMFELLTARSLFSDTTPMKMLDRVKNMPVPDLRDHRPDLPEGLAKIAAKALQRDLDRRYATAGDMGHDLEYFMYHKGYGPTNVTLGRYVRKEFLGLDVEPGVFGSDSIWQGVSSDGETVRITDWKEKES